MTGPAERSAIGEALKILGDRWVLLILQRAFMLRIRTFTAFRDELGISESVLAERLKELVHNGVFTKAPYVNGRTRYEYRLTERGLGLWILLVAIYGWEHEWAGRADHPRLVHDGCGSVCRPYLGCASCAGPVAATDTEITRGPRCGLAQLGLPRHHRRTSARIPSPDPLGYYPDSMAILGDRWSTVLLASAFLGARRFLDFQRELAIAPSVLADRLRRFTELGALLSTDDGDGRPVYRLTGKGSAFFGVFAFLVDWAQHNLPSPEGSELTIVHRICGRTLAPVLFCGACDGRLARKEIRYDLRHLGR